MTDGPFTESKELVGGFAILKADSKAEAVELVRQFLQVVGEGECELRQLYDGYQAGAADCVTRASRLRLRRRPETMM